MLRTALLRDNWYAITRFLSNQNQNRIQCPDHIRHLEMQNKDQFLANDRFLLFSRLNVFL